MNNPKLISFSINKDFLTITYSLNGKEIHALIPPFTASTYFVDLGIAQGRGKPLGKLSLLLRNTWMEWRQFIIEAGIVIEYRMPEILERHHNVEALKHVHYTINN